MQSNEEGERPIVTMWEGGVQFSLRGITGLPVTVQLNWLELEELLQCLGVGVKGIPDIDLRTRLQRLWGSKYNGDSGDAFDRSEDRRNTRRF